MGVRCDGLMLVTILQGSTAKVDDVVCTHDDDAAADGNGGREGGQPPYQEVEVGEISVLLLCLLPQDRRDLLLPGLQVGPDILPGDGGRRGRRRGGDSGLARFTATHLDDQEVVLCVLLCDHGRQ